MYKGFIYISKDEFRYPTNYRETTSGIYIQTKNITTIEICDDCIVICYAGPQGGSACLAKISLEEVMSRIEKSKLKNSF